MLGEFCEYLKIKYNDLCIYENLFGEKIYRFVRLLMSLRYSKKIKNNNFFLDK